MSEGFSTYAQEYDTHFTHTLIGKAQRERVYRLFNRYAIPVWAVASGKCQLLELNCGTGEDAVWLAQQNYKVVATDAAQGMVDVTKQKVQAHGLSTNIQVENIPIQVLSQKLDKKKFDVVFSNFGGLNCLNPNELKQLAIDCETLTEPNGLLMFVVMGRKCLWEKLFFYSRKQSVKAKRRLSKTGVKTIIHDHEFGTWYYSPEELYDCFNDNFECVSAKPIGVFIPPSYLEKWVKRHSLLFYFLAQLERLFGNISRWSNYADHYMMVMRKKS